MSEQKLIVEQPTTVTVAGAVEHVVVDQHTKKTNVRESTKTEPQEDVLLNEGPDDDGFVIVTD